MKNNPASLPPTPPRPGGRSFLLAAVTLLAVLAALFARSFEHDQILFSSDGPLGNNAASYAAMPQAFSGMWLDLNWVGGPAGSAFPSFTYLLLWVLGPLGFAKFYTPLCLLSLGLAAWVCFRQLGFRPVACVLGALAAALNTSFLSYGCWGLGMIPLCVAWIFLAIGALMTAATRRFWLKAALAGLATGMAVVEGFDTGAILSLYVAAFVVFLAWQTGGTTAERAKKAAGRLTLVAVMAAFIAAQALTVLIGTQVKGVAGMAQDEATKEARWNEATQWSLPKLETLRVIIPGLFGYRMDTPDGGNYWGRVGETPGHPGTRHSGSGVYGGVLVAVLAFWAMLQALRGERSVFNAGERRMIWFWSGALVVSLVLAWGRHAPFYRLVYALPYFSTIRNPVKFMHPFSLALVVLFAFGVNALARQYLAAAGTTAASFSARWKTWWAGASVFDRRWTVGSAAALGVSLVSWLLYASSRNNLEAFLGKYVSAKLAPDIAGFSLTEVGWSLLFLALALLFIVLMVNGTLAGTRARWTCLGLGFLLAADLARASLPWIVYDSYAADYTPNDLTEILRAKPYEHRMAFIEPRQQQQFIALLQPTFGPERLQQTANFYMQMEQLYHVDWLQKSFRYDDIQSLDLVQEPRPSIENLTYRTKLGYYGDNLTAFLRIWQLTNTRYLLGLGGGFCDALNAQLDPIRKRFRVHAEFGLEQAKPGAAINVHAASNGPLALIEFTGALPRARLYPHWQVSTNDDATLATLANPEFDPAQTVLVASAPAITPGTSTNSSAGPVDFVRYTPKHIQLKARADAPCVLLLNDKFDPNWSVTVDGRPAELLRCNYLMRGVALPAGDHDVRFNYAVPMGPFFVSLMAVILGLGLVALALRDGGKPQPSAQAS